MTYFLISLCVWQLCHLPSIPCGIHDTSAQNWTNSVQLVPTVRVVKCVNVGRVHQIGLDRNRVILSII